MNPRPTLRPVGEIDPRWPALLYVLDELDEASLLAFEARLENDPEACLAVAEAVELLGACVGVRGESIRVSSASRGRRRAGIGLMALAGAAGIVLATSLIAFRSSSDPGETIALELAWSTLDRETIPDPGETDRDAWPVDPMSDLSPPATEEGNLDIENDAQGDPAPPDWLIAAVELDDEAPVHDPGPLEY